ncbi:RIP metalloprotease RseP [Candidatus Parcubacteria bacterium]|nr:RIP metalloprotease RseP [Candidatus Parcubacteria bacterium]
MFTFIIFIAVLSILVFVHELGHFWVARKCGLKPEEFGLGMPPRAIATYRDKEGKKKTVFGGKEIKDASDTIYSLNWLPLGGFVKLGEDDTEVNDDPNRFANKPIWQRAIILLAGVTMNILLAIVLLSIGFMVGSPQIVNDDIKRGAIIENKKIQVAEVLSDSPAERAEIEVGDIILSIDGEKFTSYNTLRDFVNNHNGEKLNYKIKHGDDIIHKEITPVTIEETGKGGVGVGIVETAIVKYPFHLAIWNGITKTFLLVWLILIAFFELFKSLFTGNGVGVDVAGPIGIATITGQVAKMGFIYLLQFTAMLSINLAIINALPFPALDGGRVLFLIIEKFKGSPVKKEIEGAIHYAGFALLMVLILVVTVKDISQYGDFFRGIWDKVVG